MNFFGFLTPFLSGVTVTFFAPLFATFAVLFGIYCLVRLIDV